MSFFPLCCPLPCTVFSSVGDAVDDANLDVRTVLSRSIRRFCIDKDMYSVL